MDIMQAQPKKYLAAVDLGGQQRVGTIESVVMERVGDDDKPVIRFSGIQKGLVLNRTNSTVIAAAYGNETNNWTGKQITLFSTVVPFQGRMVDSIRVSAVSQATPAATPQQPEPSEASQDDQPNDPIPWN